MFKRHTKYKFETTIRCPACCSTDIVDFEAIQEIKITHVYRCQKCDFEEITVYDLSDDNVWDEPEHIRDKKNKWAGEFETFGQPEDEILFWP